MREKEYVKEKSECYERINYRVIGTGESNGSFPICVYYDVLHRRCTLNGCIKNMTNKLERKVTEWQREGCSQKQ